MFLTLYTQINFIISCKVCTWCDLILCNMKNVVLDFGCFFDECCLYHHSCHFGLSSVLNVRMHIYLQPWSRSHKNVNGIVGFQKCPLNSHAFLPNTFAVARLFCSPVSTLLDFDQMAMLHQQWNGIPSYNTIRSMQCFACIPFSIAPLARNWIRLIVFHHSHVRVVYAQAFGRWLLCYSKYGMHFRFILLFCLHLHSFIDDDKSPTAMCCNFVAFRYQILLIIFLSMFLSVLCAYLQAFIHNILWKCFDAEESNDMPFDHCQHCVCRYFFSRFQQ